MKKSYKSWSRQNKTREKTDLITENCGKKTNKHSTESRGFEIYSQCSLSKYLVNSFVTRHVYMCMCNTQYISESVHQQNIVSFELVVLDSRRYSVH